MSTRSLQAVDGGKCRMVLGVPRPVRATARPQWMRNAARAVIVGGLAISVAACASAPPPGEPPLPVPASPLPPDATAVPAVPTETEELAPTATALPHRPPATTSPCPVQESGGLISELERISATLPGPDSEGMRRPELEQMVAWSAVVEAASRNDLDTACRLVAAQGFPYQVVEFTDLPNASERVVLLREREPVTTGWGTYVLRPDAARDVLIEVPHPLTDSRTRSQGVVLFRSLSAKGLLMAGAHRCANSAPANCGGTTIVCGPIGPYRESDVAHATQTMFQAAHQALAPCAGESLTIQLHGNSLSTCPDLFISNGSTQPGEVSRALYREARRACPDRTIDLADGEQGECGFYGNGAQASYHALCAQGWDMATCPDSLSRSAGPERYLSLEQSWALRQDYSCLVDALERALK